MNYMNLELLRQHIGQYKKFIVERSDEYKSDVSEREERKRYYASWTPDRIGQMSEQDFYEFLSKLWAMRIWGNKAYVSEKLIRDNGLDALRRCVIDVVWGDGDIATRWDSFRARIKGMGPAMISEILCHVHPNEFMLWNNKAYVGLIYLGVAGLPSYDYQINGNRYVSLCAIAKDLAAELRKAGVEECDLLALDYFIWHELQIEEDVDQLVRTKRNEALPQNLEESDKQTSEFIHNEVRDKLAEIGHWLGFKTNIEVQVAAGSKVDTVWEATIGNMGRVIYVFEVQTKGSIDSLIINLLKSLKNPAVQGIVAVSDVSQIDRIRKHAADVAGLHDKLKYWNYEQVLRVHEALQSAYESINSLGLVPESF